MTRLGADLFWKKVDKSGACWNWTAALKSNGYGHFATGPNGGQKAHLAHRFSYELTVGPIPEGLVLDHKCRNRRCVNPDHLEAVTQRENLLRGDTFQAANAAKTHCPEGHPYTGDNLIVNNRGSRVCRACKRRTDRRSYAARSTAAPPSPSAWSSRAD